MIDMTTILAALGAAASVAGPVVVWLVRIEHRLTKMETTIAERMPARGAA